MTKGRLEQIMDSIAEEVFNLWWEHLMQKKPRLHMERVLPAIAQASPSVLTTLANHLDNENLDVRHCALVSIGAIGSVAGTGPILWRIARLMFDHNQSCQVAALHAAGRLGAAAATEEMLKALADLLDCSPLRVRTQACLTIKRMGGAVATDLILSRLAKLLRDPHHNMEREHLLKATLEALDHLGSEAALESILATLPELLSWGGSTRIAAAHVVGGITEKASKKALIAWIRKSIQNKEPKVRFAAAWLVEFGAIAITKDILKCLGNLLKDENMNVRLQAIRAVFHIGPPSATPMILERLCEVLPLINPSNWRWAMKTLGRPSGHASPLNERDYILPTNVIDQKSLLTTTEQILMHLSNLMKSNKSMIKLMATEAASRLSPSGCAHPVIELCWIDLIQPQDCDDVLCSETLKAFRFNLRYKALALEAIGRIGSTAATESILDCICRCLRHKSAQIRLAALEAISNIGPAAATVRVFNCLYKLLGIDSINVTWALCRLGHKAACDHISESLPKLLWICCRIRSGHRQKVMIQEIVEMSRSIPVDKLDKFLDCLRQLLKHNYHSVRWAALHVTNLIGPIAATSSIVQCLVHLIKGGEFESGYAATMFGNLESGYAATTLGNLGPKAMTEQVLEKLTEWHLNPKEWVRLGYRVTYQLMRQGLRVFLGNSGKIAVQSVKELSE